jgi:hypothetical protein
MKPAQVTTQMEVKEQPEALETTATASSVVMGNERIEEAPAQNRNYLNFVLVTPGVTASSGSNTQRAAASTRSFRTDSGFSFGGLRGSNNSLSIDGVDNRDETTGGNRVSVGLEMVQEFRVTGTSIAPEFGGAAGGMVNVVTHSGTNIWRGDATFFGQNELTNARNPEAEVRSNPRFRRYQPGTSLLGPIHRDRTFFGFAVEQEWESSEEFSEVPLRAQAAINAALARPEFARSPVHSISAGLFPASAASTEFSFKANHQINNVHALSARYAFSRGRVSNDVQGVDNFSDRSSRGSSLTKDHSFVAGWIAVPGPNVVNDFRIQLAQRTVDLTPNVRGAMLEVPGVVTLGQSYSLDGSRTEDHYQVVESLNVVRGRHQIGAGTSVHAVRLDARIANRFAGLFIFLTLADFLRGAPDVYSQAFGDPRTHYNTLPVGVWLQDHWQPVSGLTVEGGIRYDGQRLPAPFSSPKHNVAPRVGLAWRPGSKAPFVFRAGFGLFYDRYPLAYLNDAIQKDGEHGFEQYAAGADAARAFAAALGGTLAAPLAGIVSSVYRPDAHFPDTYSRKFTVGMERSLGANTTLTAEYANVRGFHLPRVRNINLTLPPLYQLEQTARSNYQGVSVSLNRRMSKEITYMVSYTEGRNWDDGSDYDEQPSLPANPRVDWAHSRQHQARRLVASGLFDLPVEILKTAPAWLREPLDNITIAPIFTAGSGRPINALDTTDRFRTGAYPITARPLGLARNPFFQRGAVSLDMRVMKSWWVVKPRRAVMQASIDAFNLLNHTNPLRVSPFYAAGTQPLNSYRGIVEALNARQLQLSLQFEF